MTQPQKYKFLLITPSYACAPITGAGQRTMLIYNALKKMGAVDVIIVGTDENNDFLRSCFNEAREVKCFKPLERGEMGFWRYFRGISPKLFDLLATTFGGRKSLYSPDNALQNQLMKLYQENNYDLIIGRYLRPTVRTGALHNEQFSVVLDLDDRDDVVYRSRLNRKNLFILFRLVLIWHEKQMLKIMPGLLKKASHIWLTSEQDLLDINHYSKSVLPNIPYIKVHEANNIRLKSSLETPNSKTILFVGAFGHRVNREGVEHFITNCWPKINESVEDAKFRVVGSGGWEELKNKYHHIKNLEIVGFVEDLSSEYSRSAFSVVPLFEGGGTKIKVLESLLYKKTAVISSHAQYGYEQLRNRESLIVASNDDELVSGCVELLNDIKLCAKLAENGHANVSTYSFENFSSKIKNTVVNLLKNK